MNQGKGTRPDWSMATETRILSGMFREMKVGDQFTYDELSKAIGMDVRKTGSFHSARRIVLRENIVIVTIRGVGVMRGDNDASIEKTAEYSGPRIAANLRKAKKYLNVAANDYENLKQDQKTKVVLHATRISLIESVQREKAAKKLEHVIVASNALSSPVPLSIASGMDAIKE